MVIMYWIRAKLIRHLTLARFRVRMLRLAVTMRPIAGAEEPPEPTEKPAGSEADAEKKDEAAEEEKREEEPEAQPADDLAAWKEHARKHERNAKQAAKERDRLTKTLADREAALKAREDAEKSDHEKAIEAARTTTREELQTEFDRERRQDRLEVATTKLAAKGVKLGSGDKAKTVRFADPDDALVHIERDIRAGTIDADDLYDKDGRVRSDQLSEALTDLLERKPHLAAQQTRKVDGTADAGRGEPASAESSVEDHFKTIRRNQPENDRQQASKYRQVA